MAVISSNQDALVVRIVYDGPPMAGKTSSLRALASKLGGSLQTPAEIDGRTLYFDWLDYTGGLFEGRRIRCQIVSVPGQASLASRRRALLETADAVVFVSDTTRDAAPQCRSYLKAARAALGSREGPTVGIVLQANKRDHVDALPLSELRRALDAPDEKVAIVESVATDGSGIREAFVFAVRLALDRVRELMRGTLLKTTEPEIDSAEALLAEFAQREQGKLELAAVDGLKHTRLILEQAPSLPRSDLPGGMIWPPVEGRLILHEATANTPILHQDADGSWRSSGSPGWLIHSPAQGQFHDLSAARSAMLEWARAHSAHAKMLGGRRCIALSHEGAGSYRLWQFVSASADGPRLMPFPVDEAGWESFPASDPLARSEASKR
jgi:signal recognition particle receptor subunit beta